MSNLKEKKSGHALPAIKMENNELIYAILALAAGDAVAAFQNKEEEEQQAIEQAIIELPFAKHVALWNLYCLAKGEFRNYAMTVDSDFVDGYAQDHFDEGRTFSQVFPMFRHILDDNGELTCKYAQIDKNGCYVPFVPTGDTVAAIAKAIMAGDIAYDDLPASLRNVIDDFD